MKIILNIFKYIIVIILTLSLIGLIILNILSNSFFSKDYILSKLNETNYYSKMYNNVESNFENYIGQSGLEKEVLENVITEKKIKNDTNIIITNIYENKKDEISTEEIKDNLNNNINEFLKGTYVTNAQKKSLADYVDLLCTEYKKTILNSKYEDKVSSVLQSVLSKSSIINKYLIISAIISSIILIVLNIKKIICGLKQITMSITSSGIILLIGKMYLCSKVKVNNLSILNEPFSDSLKNIINELLSKISFISIIEIITGLALIIIFNVLYAKKDKKE